MFIKGKSFSDYLNNYKKRGMDFFHDVHDWLGGYPYESIFLNAKIYEKK